MVLLGNNGDHDRFFVLTWAELRNIAVSGYKQYLENHGGTRPKATGSLHCSLPVSNVERFENRWDTILRMSPGKPG